MSEQNGFDLLAQKRQAASIGGGQELNDAQHAKSKMTARERIDKLLDAQSFVETYAFVQHSNALEGLKEVSALGEGVVTGYGTVGGCGVYVFSQDYTVLGGAIGTMHARKICKLLELAGKTGLPVVAFLDSMGARIGEGAGALEGFGSILTKMAELSGVVPVITVICGQCAGTAAFFAPLSDFVFMTEGVSGLYTTAPGAFNEMGKASDANALGGAAVHAEKTGLAHFKCASEDETIFGVKQLLSYLPDNNIVDAPMADCTDDLNRLIQNYEDAYDAREMIGSVLDNSVFLESQAAFAPSMLTGFGRINGRTVGVVANAPGADIDAKGAEKAAGFVSFCDAFGLPIVTFADTPGFIKNKEQEQCCLIPAGGRLIRAYAEATAPMLTVITGKAIGAGYVAMGPKAMGADMVFAWPNAQISCVSAEAAAIIMQEAVQGGSREEAADSYAKTFASPWEAAKMGYVDEVIYPSETRQRLVGALELALGKRENKLPKKHGTRL